MATVAPRDDPRVTSEASVLPVVARPSQAVPIWMIVLVVILLGVILFAVLNARRSALTAPSVRPRAADQLQPAAPPPLFIPTAPAPIIVAMPVPAPMPSLRPAVPVPQMPPQIVYVQPPAPATMAPDPPARPARVTADPALVIDTTGAAATRAGDSPAPPATDGATATATVAGSRASAGMLANRATTVPQGTLIPAVLETPLDSTRPGLARAIVSRDIRGFDGSRVLIPRGSRLIGEYRSDAEAGQNRMLVNWIRLVRPDGATIAIGSPASDPLGRAGIRASVNSHFFERFASAILQSSLDIGVNLASRSVRSPVVVALPNSIQGGNAGIAPKEVRPTLKVKAATSISIFVARDLDFTGVESR